MCKVNEATEVMTPSEKASFRGGVLWHKQQGYRFTEADAVSLVEYITDHYCYLNPKRIVQEWLKERESK